MWIAFIYLYLATVVLCTERPRGENRFEDVKKSLHFRRAIDGRNGRNYFSTYNDGSYDYYDSSGGDHDSSQTDSGISSIRGIVPGEPGVDFPIYTRAPKTQFSCQGRVQGYYADEETGCQAFHVCHNVMVSSYVCPIGSVFSQKLLTCDWWNKVDCSTSKVFYPVNQNTYKDTREMVEKAYAMMKLPEHKTPINNVNGFEDTTVLIDRRIGPLASILGEEPENYKTQNFGFTTTNNQPNRNFVNVNLVPKNSEAYYQGPNSRFNNRDEEASITYVQNNFDDRYPSAYTTFRPATLQNYFQNPYQQNDGYFSSGFQPSYAPTVPTVTTTTRKLYSPTVPPPTSTTYRASTASYNEYDQDLESSDHLYTHRRNINRFTTASSKDYRGSQSVANGYISRNPYHPQYKESRQAVQVGVFPVANQDGNGFSQIIPAKVRIAIRENSRKNVRGIESEDQQKNVRESETDQSSGGLETKDTNYDSNTNNSRTSFGMKSSSFNSNASSNKPNYRHFYSALISNGKEFGQRSAEILGSMTNDYTDGTVKREDDDDDDDSNLSDLPSKIPPLIVQIPRPTASSAGRPVLDIADQLFSFDSFANTSSSTTETLPPTIASGAEPSDGINRDGTSDSSAGIPPLFSETPQPVQPADVGSSKNDVPPLISQSVPSIDSPSPQPIGASGIDSSKIDNPAQGFGSSTRIPLLIPSTSQSGSSSGSGVVGSSGIDSSKIDNPTQGFGFSTRIPLLIPPSSQSGSSSGSGVVGTSGIDSSKIDDSTPNFDVPSVIPPLFPQFTQTESSAGSEGVGSSGIDSSKIDNPAQDFGFSTRIPLLIPPSSQSGSSQGSEVVGSSGIDSSKIDDSTQNFDFPSVIPPLFPQSTQTEISTGSEGVGSSRIDSSKIDNPTQGFDSPSRIPALIPSVGSDGVESSGIDSSKIDNPTQAVDVPSRIPPLIPQSDQSETSDFPREIPPLFPQSTQSESSSGSQGSGSSGIDSSKIDNPTQGFDSPSRIPALIPSVGSDGVESSGIDSSKIDNPTQAVDVPNRIPPLIPQSDQSETSDFPREIPPLFPQSTQSESSSGSQGSGSSGIDSSKIDNPTQGFDSPSRIPALIPSVGSDGVESSGIDSSKIDNPTQGFDSPSRIPALIPSVGSDGVESSGIDSSKIDNPTQAVDVPNRIPPLIPQSDQSETSDFPREIPPLFPQSTQSESSSGSQGSGSSGIDSSKIDNPTQGFDSPSRIPALIPSVGSDGVESSGIDSSKIDNPTQAVDVPNRIPPLIPQSDQSDTSDFPREIPPLFPQSTQSESSSGSQGSGSSGIDSSKIDNPTQGFDSPSRIPALIPSVGSDGVESSGIDSSKIDNPTQAVDVPNRIPPLIPQSDQSDTSDFPREIPPLFPQSTQSESSSGSQGSGSSGIDSSKIDNPTQGFDSPSRIPALIPSVGSDGVESSGIDSSKIDNPTQAVDVPNRIPPLIPQSDQSETSDFPREIPPLFPQSTQSESSSGSQGSGSSGIDSSKIDNPTQGFDSPSRIPALIPSVGSDGVESSGIDSSKIDNPTQGFDSPSRIPALIPSVGSDGVESSGIDSSKIDNPTQAVDVPNRIPPLIPQSDQSETSDFPREIPPLFPQSTQSESSSGSQGSGSSGIDSSKIDNPTQGFDSPSRIPALIPSVGSDGVESSGIDSSKIDNPTQAVDVPNRIPPLIPQSDQSDTSDFPREIPPLFPQSTQSESSSGSQGSGSSGIDSSKIDNPTQGFDSPSRIPALIPSVGSDGVESSGIDSSKIDNPTQAVDVPNRIPPLIPQSDQSDTSDFPREIPPLFPQSTQSESSSGSQGSGSSGIDSSKIDNPTQAFDVPSRVPPLIPQSTQSETPDFSSDIPPLFPQSTLSESSSGSQGAGSSGIDSSKIDNPTQVPDVPSRVPSLIPQSSQSETSPDFPSDIPPLFPQSTQSESSSGSQESGSSGIDSSKIDNPTQAFDVPSRVPPLIPQSTQSETPDFSSDIPPLFPQSTLSESSSGSQGAGSSGIDSSKIDNPTQAPDVPSRVPPLIPQSTQSETSPDFPSDIPPLFPQFAQSGSFSGSQGAGSSGLDSSEIDNPTQASDVPFRVPPLIPQSTQSGISDFPSEIPPLFLQSPQSGSSSGLQGAGSSGIDSSKIDNPTKFSDNSSEIPLLIPFNSTLSETPSRSQSDGSSGTDSPKVDDPTEYFDFPSVIPPLFPQSTQSESSSGSQGAGSSGIDSSKIDNPTQGYDFPSRIPPLIQQSSGSETIGSSGINSSKIDDSTQYFDFPSIIQPLFPESTQSEAPSRSQGDGSSGIDSEKIDYSTESGNSPGNIPPLIPQSAGSESSFGTQGAGSSGIDPSKINNPTQEFDVPSRIPPLFPQFTQSESSSGSQGTGSSGINSSKIDRPLQAFDFSTYRPPLIPQSMQNRPSTGSQADGSFGINFSQTDDSTQTVESSTRKPTVSLGEQYPNGIYNNNNLYSPFSLIRQYSSHLRHSVEASAPHNLTFKETFESSTTSSEIIPHPFQSGSSTEAYPPYDADRKHVFSVPPWVPSFNSLILRPQSPIFDRGGLSYSSINQPLTNSQKSQSSDPSATQSTDNRFNTFNSYSSNTEQPHFTFPGQYQRPQPFDQSRRHSQQSNQAFGTAATTEIPTYGFNAESTPRTEATTVSPIDHSAYPTTEEFIIRVPDFPITEESYFTPSTTSSPSINPYWPAAGPPKTFVGDQSLNADSSVKKSFTTSSPVDQTRGQVNTANKFPNTISTLFPQQSQSFLPSSTGNKINKFANAGEKIPTLASSSATVQQSNPNLFKQAFGLGDWQKYNNNLRFTIRGAPLYSTAAPFSSSETKAPIYHLQSTRSPPDPPEQKVLFSKVSTIGELNPGNVANGGRSDQRAIPNVTKTSVENTFTPTSSQSPFEDPGYLRDRFQFGSPQNILNTSSIKPVEYSDTTKQGFVPAKASPSLPEGFERIESSINNNDSPYEISITVNGDEDFNPSGEFITQLLAQHGSDPSLGISGLEGYEIIKSDDSGSLADTVPADPTPAPNIKSSTTPNVTRVSDVQRGSDLSPGLSGTERYEIMKSATPGSPVDPVPTKPTPVTHSESSTTPKIARVFDVRGSFSDTKTQQIQNQNAGSVIPSSKPSAIQATRTEVLRSGNTPQPFVYNNYQNAFQPRPNFKYNQFPTFNVPYTQPRDRVNLPNLKVKPGDLNLSLESLFEPISQITTSSPQMKEHILEQLTKNFGQPLYNENSEKYSIPFRAFGTANYNAGRQFADLAKYRVAKNDGVKPATSMTTTTTTPKPVKTHIETELIPSLSFSFDSDEGRQQYVEALLHGILTDNRAINTWKNEANSFTKFRDNSKSENKNTTKT